MATSCEIRRCVARYTMPIPPTPRTASIVYLPAMSSPGFSATGAATQPFYQRPSEKRRSERRRRRRVARDEAEGDAVRFWKEVDRRAVERRAAERKAVLVNRGRVEDRPSLEIVELRRGVESDELCASSRLCLAEVDIAAIERSHAEADGARV